MREMELNSDVRDENLIWSINQNYDFAPEITLVQKTDVEALDVYRMIVFGVLYLLENHQELIDYLKAKEHATKRAGIFYELMMLTLEELLHERIKKELAGASDLEKAAIWETLSFYDKMRKRPDAFHEIRYAYYANKASTVPKTNRRVVDLLNDILQFREIKSSDYAISLENLMKKHFYFESLAEIKVSEHKFQSKDEKKEKNQSNRFKNRESKVENAENEAIMSAEFSQVDIGKSIQLMEKDMADAPKDSASTPLELIRRRIVESYGEASIFGARLQELERKLCVGIHEGEKLYITERFMEIEGYKRQMLMEQMDENIAHFDYLHRVYRRNIIRLVDLLNRSITADTDYSASKLDNGIMMPSQIWRRAILGDNKVFYKNIRDVRGEFVVDILLDASGSQIERQSLVATQGYIIAEALSQVGIACRVSSFHNLFDYTILKIYRDYKDSASRNRRIFAYQAEGSNRDGLAIATTGDFLLAREEEHKILIVLSDGKPNDERVSGFFNQMASTSKVYTGDLAIDDTAHQVRLLRAKGIAVLGVFTGNDADLDAERRIFGKDFAYIAKLQRFSDIVGMYLKKQISNMEI